MYIREININGFLTYENLNLHLDNNLNIFIGTNGTGKTNLLNLINYCICDKQQLLNCINNNIGGKKIITIRFSLRDKNNLLSQNGMLINKLLTLNFIYPFSSRFYENTNENKLLINNIIELIYNKIDEIIITHYIYNNHVNTQITTNEIKCNNDNIINILDHNCKCKYSNLTDCFLNNPKINNASHTSVSNDSWLINHLQYLFYHKNQFIGLYLQRDEQHFFNETNKLLNVNIFIEILKNMLFVSQKNTYTHINDFNNIVKNINAKNDLLNVEHHNNYINGFVKINIEYTYRQTIYKIKNEESDKYKKIQQKYYQICNKNFDIIINNNGLFTDYIIINDNSKQKCSSGEHEIIYFLLNIYNDNMIMLFDEPCAYINSGNKFMLLSDTSMFENKQIIVVSHDKHFININNIKNSFYFQIKNNVTTIIKLDIFDEKQQKIIYENSDILFNNKIIVVEGFYDYLIMIKLMKIYNDVIIIYDNSKSSKIFEILNKLSIKNKFLYDIDALSKLKCKNIDNDTKRDEKTDEFIQKRLPDKFNKLTFEKINEIANYINDNNDCIYIHLCDVKDIEGLMSIILGVHVDKKIREKKLKEIYKLEYEDIIVKDKIKEIVEFFNKW